LTKLLATFNREGGLPETSKVVSGIMSIRRHMSTVRQYELIYILPPETTEEAVAELQTQVEAITQRFSATIEKTENWGRRKLAYEIGGNREGVYVLHVINGPAEMTAELDRRLRVFDLVIRHMVVRVDEELAVAERARVRRKSSMTARRVRRGLPPEPTEQERSRRQEDNDDLDGPEMGFRERGDR
jgi:small subunit ribosomal protein S6